MSKNKKIKRPNPIVWMIMELYLIGASIFRRKVRITFKTRDGRVLEERQARKELKKLKAPFVMLGNHHSLYDYIFSNEGSFSS